MELSINLSNLSWRYDLSYAVTLYKNAGFTALDYSLKELLNDNCPLLGEHWLTETEKIRSMVLAVGMQVNQTHAPFSFDGWSDPVSYSEVIYPRLCRAIAVSGILGAKVAVVHPIHDIAYSGHEEELFERNMAFYKSLLPVCKEYHIRIGIENMYRLNHNGQIMPDTCSAKEELIRYIDTLDSEYITACLDTGHYALTSKDNGVPDAIHALGHDRLGALHVHDNDHQSDQHRLPYLGKLNWNEITDALREINYSGDMTFELNNEFVTLADDILLPISLSYMADVGKHLISKIEERKAISELTSYIQ